MQIIMFLPSFNTVVLADYDMSVSEVKEVVSSDSMQEEISEPSIEDESVAISESELASVEMTSESQTEEATTSTESVTTEEVIETSSEEIENDETVSSLRLKELAEAAKLPSEEISTRGVQLLSDSQQKVVTTAKQQVGKPYVWGGKGPNNFDCSGLVQYVFKTSVKMNIPALTTSQETKGNSVSLKQLEAGDLLFWGQKGASYHSAIYIGNNQYIHAPQPGEKVKVLNMTYFKPDFAKRVLKEEAKLVDLSNYYTKKVNQVVMKKADYIYSSTEFNGKTRGKAVKKNQVIKVTGVEYSAGGYPRFKVSGGYLTTNKSMVVEVTPNIGNYYTQKVAQVVMTKDDYIYSNTDFNTKTKGQSVKKNQVIKVTGVEYSASGYPRFKVSGGYLTTNKSIVVEVTPKIENYYTKKVDQVVMKKADYIYSSTEFNEKTKGKAVKKNQVIKVTDVEYNSGGYPRFKVPGGYLSASKSIVQEQIVNQQKGQATAYVATGNLTATGTVPTVKRTIAVDPKVIPLGSKVRITVPGSPQHSGVYIAEDTGGAVKGNIIDIFVGSYKEAIQFGRQTIYFEIIKK